MKGRPTAILASLAVIVFAAAGGIAYASIPDAGGKYHACMKQNGNIRIIDPATDACLPGIEKEITFNQQGPQGIPGTPGTPGVSPTVQQLAAGDTHCPAGGAAITDANGSTAYVCSGQPFSGTFTSPNGKYGISVLDTGVTVSGQGARITLTGGNINIEHAQDITVRADNNLTLAAAANVSARGGLGAILQGDGSTEIRTGGVLGIDGGFVQVNGPSCQLAARLGDPIFGTADSSGNVTGSIISGSPTVCIG